MHDCQQKGGSFSEGFLFLVLLQQKSEVFLEQQVKNAPLA
jgi:hypothetical protein